MSGERAIQAKTGQAKISQPKAFQPKTIQPKLAWANKFQRPTAAQLMAQFGTKQLGQLVEAARGELVGFGGVEEALSWQGVPWRWTFVYSMSRVAGLSPALQHPLAYLIADPQKPQVAVPLSGSMIETIPMRRLKRFVRDGILHGRLVGEVHWPCWDFSARSQLDEILDLVTRKYKFLVAAGKQPVAERV